MLAPFAASLTTSTLTTRDPITLPSVVRIPPFLTILAICLTALPHHFVRTSGFAADNELPFSRGDAVALRSRPVNAVRRGLCRSAHRILAGAFRHAAGIC